MMLQRYIVVFYFFTICGNNFYMHCMKCAKSINKQQHRKKYIHFRLWPLLKRTLGVDICAMGCLWTIWCVVLEAVPEIHSFVFNLPWPCLLASVIYTDRCSHLKWIQRSEYQSLKSAMLAKCCCSASKQSYIVIL